MQGFVVRGEGRWKNLEAWFDAMETRPTYLATRSDHYTHVHDLPPQLGGIPTHFKIDLNCLDLFESRGFLLPSKRNFYICTKATYTNVENVVRMSAARDRVQLEVMASNFAEGCASVPGSEELAAAIDGTDGKSWNLPLSPLSSASIPEAFSPGKILLQILNVVSKRDFPQGVLKRVLSGVIGSPTFSSCFI